MFPSNKEFQDVLCMKKMNLIKIKDLLSVNNIDFYSLYKAKQDQHYINARLASMNPRVKMVHINTDFSSDTEKNSSKFVKFESTDGDRSKRDYMSNKKLFDNFCVNMKNLMPTCSNMTLDNVKEKCQTLEQKPIIPVDFNKIEHINLDKKVITEPVIEDDTELLFDKIIMDEMKELAEPIPESQEQDEVYDEYCM